MRKLAAFTLVISLCGIISVANARIIPERDLRVPDTISPQLKSAIEAGLPDWWQTRPETISEWKEFQGSRDAQAARAATDLGKKLNVHWEKGQMAGVPVFMEMFQFSPLICPHPVANGCPGVPKDFSQLPD